MSARAAIIATVTILAVAMGSTVLIIVGAVSSTHHNQEPPAVVHIINCSKNCEMLV